MYVEVSANDYYIRQLSAAAEERTHVPQLLPKRQ